MRHLKWSVLLVVSWAIITYLTVTFNLPSYIYFSLSLLDGVVLGWLSGKAGYEA
jgi:hypothetical protein